jgi:predicted enzyme related to lactoylglutathione lyase
MMAGLSNIKAAAVLRAEDYQRAKRFYVETLGLKLDLELNEPMAQGIFAAGEGTTFMVYERPGMPAPQNTTLRFVVSPERFPELVADLRARGVVFEEYDLPAIGLKTVDGVADYGGCRVAWFKDTEGNILNVCAM